MICLLLMFLLICKLMISLFFLRSSSSPLRMMTIVFIFDDIFVVGVANSIVSQVVVLDTISLSLSLLSLSLGDRIISPCLKQCSCPSFEDPARIIIVNCLEIFSTSEPFIYYLDKFFLLFKKLLYLKEAFIFLCLCYLGNVVMFRNTAETFP